MESNSKENSLFYDDNHQEITIISPNKIVIVVDTENNIKEISRTLGEFGLEVVQYTENFPAESATVALINPKMDPQFELCKSLSKKCKVLLTTDDRAFEFKIMAVHMGAKGLLSLPVNAVEVLSNLEETRKSDMPEARVLIIDDDELTATVYALALEKCGLRVEIIHDPLQAEATIEDFRPDLVIMDIDMPQANGIDVAQAIRLDPAYTSLPIMFLSSIYQKDIQELAREIGGDDFIKKPVDVNYLVKMVRMRAARAVELRQIMVRDGLTGLLNHVAFKERLTGELNRSKRTMAAFTVALLDLDHFKSINDTYGHQVGDTVIQTFATLLKNSFRNIDIIARYGGEEFAIILLDATPDQSEKTINRIRSAFEHIEFSATNRKFHVTFSCGLAGSNANTSEEALLSAADIALYQAKANGRNCVCMQSSGSEFLNTANLKE
ncbi:diguanylate cyclase [Roseibium marinum]|uniref:diguanylate cyclase n=1 Tax=Roseibium marinum TaxID=281252 RepID=A0A2S3UPI1_9HYPH|nr:diguanylate cyclase [Roseibium marinum]POF29622.1 diguanylate cyclase (GGDEF)-like protein [Roseibium marinum]